MKVKAGFLAIILIFCIMCIYIIRCGSVPGSANLQISNFRMDSAYVQSCCTYELIFKWDQLNSTPRSTDFKLLLLDISTLEVITSTNNRVASMPPTWSSTLFVPHYLLDWNGKNYLVKMVWTDSTTGDSLDGSFLNIVLNPSTVMNQQTCLTCCNRANLHVGMHIIDSTGIDAVEANILMRTGNPCNPNGGTEPAFGFAYIGIMKQSLLYDDESSVQMGCGYFRDFIDFNDYDAHNVYYVEISDSAGRHFIDIYDSSVVLQPKPPINGQISNFKIVLESSIHTWHFYYDGNLVGSYPDPNDMWLNRFGGVDAQFMGEVFNGEDDMPGNVNSPCRINYIKYNGNGVTSNDSTFYVNDNQKDFGLDTTLIDDVSFWEK